eukprot:COSAG03_NODE_10336_length_656_cov_3.678636_1_plen_47_part_10
MIIRMNIIITCTVCILPLLVRPLFWLVSLWLSLALSGSLWLSLALSG